MYKQILLISSLMLLSSCGNETIAINSSDINQSAQALKASPKNSLVSSDITQDIANKIASALDLNNDNVVDSQEIHLSLNSSKVTNYDSLGSKPLAPIAVSKITSTLLEGGTVSLSNYKNTTNEKILSNLAQAFAGDSINNGKKIKAFSTNIPYMAISKVKTLVASLNAEQLAKKLNDGVSGIGMVSIFGASKMIDNKEKSRIKFSIYADFDKKLPLFSSNTYSNVEVK